MKIQVGKTYTNSNGKYYIECKLTHSFLGRPAGSFLGTNIIREGFEIFNEEGVAVTVRGHLVSESQLRPPMVKKEGWISLGDRRVDSDRVAESSNYVYATEELARRNWPYCSKFIKVEWEEEES